MDEFSVNYEDMVKRVINRSTRLENIPYTNYNELIYYDDYNNVILQKKIFKDNGVTYDINENEYDEYGNITISYNTYILDNRVVTFKSKTFYEYIYDPCNRIIQKNRYNDDHIPCEMIKYYYDNNNMVKTEYYKYQDVDVPDYINIKRYDFSAPYKVHYFTYDAGFLKEEKVCLHTGDISYYKVYENGECNGQFINPFRSEYSWTIDSISFGTIEISIKENKFHGEMLIYIVDTILKHYSNCDMILLNLSFLKNLDFDQDSINIIIEMYQKNRHVTINYVQL